MQPRTNIPRPDPSSYSSAPPLILMSRDGCACVAFVLSRWVEMERLGVRGHGVLTSSSLLQVQQDLLFQLKCACLYSLSLLPCKSALRARFSPSHLARSRAALPCANSCPAACLKACTIACVVCECQRARLGELGATRDSLVKLASARSLAPLERTLLSHTVIRGTSSGQGWRRMEQRLRAPRLGS